MNLKKVKDSKSVYDFTHPSLEEMAEKLKGYDEIVVSQQSIQGISNVRAKFTELVGSKVDGEPIVGGKISFWKV